ncbi:MAG TPA: ImmA/IrrE family metallo-endopeptidase [Solirubrobacteraceae bacterium]|jgi:Zn-dependent peptidase ImmA (M78 family)|nr:ImmA/IrrE family metallo-endopeptidase [Solirubrobacteraceae bacterium]
MTKQSPAEKRAADLLESSGVGRLPVPVEKIARHLGAEIQYEAFDGQVSGMLYRGEGQTLIGVNSTHGATRQRFTLAHECGHLVLHKGVFIDRLVRVNWRDGTSDAEEVEANAFAAELLMPRTFMKGEIERLVARSRKITPELLIAELAETFRVSQEAMRYRLVNLGVLGPYAGPNDA